MKPAFITVLSSLCLLLYAETVNAMDAVAAPNFGVGTSWTFKRINIAPGADKGKVVEEYTNTVTGKTDVVYQITKDNNCGVPEEFAITRSGLGQASPVRGSQGDGKLYQFPLVVGLKWDTKRHFFNCTIQALGYTTMTYEVVGEEEIVVLGRKYRTVKIGGKGWWNNAGFTGTMKEVVNYAPEVGTAVRIERAVGPGSFDITEIVLEAFEIK